MVYLCRIYNEYNIYIHIFANINVHEVVTMIRKHINQPGLISFANLPIMYKQKKEKKVDNQNGIPLLKVKLSQRRHNTIKRQVI